jgi:N-methylhydantoinase B/oxoprolinase/acetone carboxylase alpha subunit
MSYPTLEEKLASLKVSTPTEYELSCIGKVGTGDYEIGVQRTADILDEGYEVFMRSSRSQMGVAGDSIVAIFTAAGDLVNASAGTYLHAVIPPIVIKYILKSFQENPGILDGDIWYTNDALYGGIHNPDQVAIMPVFFEGELVAWTAALSHTTETGATEPGGMPVSAKSRFDEGMNLPPMKIGADHQIRADIIEMFAAFGLRSETSVTVDLRARCTTADRVRVRLLEMFAREGKDFVTGLFRKMLIEAEAGSRKRLSSWADGVYRCATFSDAAGMENALLRNCFMTMTVKDDTLLVDFTGTSPENGSSYNAHPQAVIGHLANYIYEYVFHDLPISSATFQPIDFLFPENSMLSPAPNAATSCAVMAATGAMSAIANCIGRARFGTTEWRQVSASLGNGGNASVLAGVSQWGMPFADMLAYTINTEGSGGRATQDGINAYGFPWCAFGRAPDVENMENELPMLVPFSQHWEDSGGAGKYRGGLSAESCFIPHGTDSIVHDTLSSGNAIPTSTGMMGGYPGAVNRYRFLKESNVFEKMKASELVNDIDELKGESETLQLRQQDFVQNPADVYAVLWSAGGGFGDPLERDPAKVAADVDNGDVSVEAAKAIYGVVLGDAEATEHERNRIRHLRLDNSQTRTRKVDGPVRFLATENLAVRGERYACAKCAADLGSIKDNYKLGCVRKDLPIEASNPIVGDPKRFIDPQPQFRQFACPGCGLLIENEVAVADEPLLRDVELEVKCIGG